MVLFNNLRFLSNDFKNFILKSYFHSKTLFNFIELVSSKILVFIQKSHFHSSRFRSKILFSFKKLVFIQKVYFHSITFQFAYVEITGQSRGHKIAPESYENSRTRVQKFSITSKGCYNRLK